MPYISKRGESPNAFFKFVRHPGTKPNPFTKPALIVGQDVLAKEVAAAITRCGAKNLSDLQKRLPGEINIASTRAADAVLQNSKANCPIDTKALLESLKVVQVEQFKFQLVTDKPYGVFVIKGTKPHIIRPSTPDGTLAFFWPKMPGIKFG